MAETAKKGFSGRKNLDPSSLAFWDPSVNSTGSARRRSATRGIKDYTWWWFCFGELQGRLCDKSRMVRTRAKNELEKSYRLVCAGRGTPLDVERVRLFGLDKKVGVPNKKISDLPSDIDSDEPVVIGMSADELARLKDYG